VAALEKVEGLSKAAEESAAQAKVTERELTKEIKRTQKLIADMEEDIRTYVDNIKALEAQKEQWGAEDEAESKKAEEDERKERMWKERQRHLEMRYITIYNAYQVVSLPGAESLKEVLNILELTNHSGCY
jgi:Skp family chaperone for outer membrane proteins